MFVGGVNNFHSLEVVDRVSKTQLQEGENSNKLRHSRGSLGGGGGCHLRLRYSPEQNQHFVHTAISQAVFTVSFTDCGFAINL